MHWTVTEYVAHIEEYVGRDIDYVLINSEAPSEEQVDTYALKEGDGVLVLDDYEGINARRAKLLSRTLVTKTQGDAIHDVRSFIRHDPHALAQAIMELTK